MRAAATAKWREWSLRILRDISASLESRRCWEELTRMWEVNRSLRIPNEAQRWIARIYAASAALAIRRQLDLDKDSISLMGLLRELAECAHFWTLADCLSGVEDDVGRLVVTRHASTWLCARRGHLDPAHPMTDLDRIKAAGAVAKHYADRSVAHTDRRGLTHPVTYGDLQDALRAVERVALRYHTILGGGSFADDTLLPTRQFNYEMIYRRPWLRPRWRRATWPLETVERDGDLWPRLDSLSPADYVALVRNRRTVATELGRQWEGHAPRGSPIRATLVALGLPSCDSAVEWVRDYLVLRGANWRRSSPEA